MTDEIDKVRDIYESLQGRRDLLWAQGKSEEDIRHILEKEAIIIADEHSGYPRSLHLTADKFWAAFFHRSTIVLLVSNITVVGLALYDNWSFGSFLWTYWFQSVIIGIFAVTKIFFADNFTLAGVYLNGKRLPYSLLGKSYAAGFFLIHYGLFHIAYASILTIKIGAPDISQVVYGCAIFFANHLFSFITTMVHERNVAVNIGTVLGRPYLRIIPIHMIILLGGLQIGGLFGTLFFGLIKTFIDILAHVSAHALSDSPDQVA